MSTGVLRFKTLLLAIALIATAGSVVRGQDKFSSALEAYRSGDAAGALQTLTELIEARTQDPRVYFYRGIVSTELGQAGDSDFRTGARLEAATGNTRVVNVAIEKVQGPLRARIERIRAEARADLKADPTREKLRGVFREALELRRDGNREQALPLLQQLTEQGDDPRYFYLHGVVLAEQQQTEQARALFTEALKRETSVADIQRVNDMLSSVDGKLRLLVEEQTAIKAGDQTITRSDMHQEIRRRALLSEDQLLAEANVAAAQAAEAAKSELDARRQAAAAEIVANREAQLERQRKAEANAAAIASKTPEPAETTTEPVEVAATKTPAMAPKQPSSNPFLGGTVTTPPGTTTRPSGTGTLDLSWLPASTEVLLYVRPADMENSAISKAMPAANSTSQALLSTAPDLGIAPADIESISVGVGNVVVSLLPVITQATAGGTPDPQALGRQLMNSDAVAVIRLLKDIDAAALATTAGGTAATEGDSTYYVIPSPQPDQPTLAIHAVDARTVIAGTEASVKAALSSGPGEKERESFSFVPGSSHTAIAFSTPLLAGMSGSIPDAPPTAPPQVAALLAAIKGRIAGVAIISDLTSDVNLTIALNLTEPEAAVEGNKALTEGLELVRQMAPLLLGGAPQELQGGLQQMVGSLASTGRGNVMSLQATIPAALLKVIQENPQMFAPQLQPGAPGIPGLPGQP
jgi:tetratricopeptide (TPR) repeat protein